MPKKFEKFSLNIKGIYKLFLDNCKKYEVKKVNNENKVPEVKKETKPNIPPPVAQDLNQSIQDLNETMYVSTGSETQRKYERTLPA